MKSIEISYNGPLTIFALEGPFGTRYLCREDLAAIVRGDLSFNDNRAEVKLDAGQFTQVAAEAKRLLAQVRDGRFRAELGVSYLEHFRANIGSYGPFDESDIGRSFEFRGDRFVLVGAWPRSRKNMIAAANLTDGEMCRFTVEMVTTLFGKESSGKMDK